LMRTFQVRSSWLNHRSIVHLLLNRMPRRLLAFPDESNY